MTHTFFRHASVELKMEKPHKVGKVVNYTTHNDFEIMK